MPYDQEQNGFIECDNRIMMETTRSILRVKGMFKLFVGKNHKYNCACIEEGHDMNFG